ncbi:EVE domain-containing protein [Candidatus Dependentiae bacterium]|nr:EVE domain-containing protein [Candidatus Dependentiae bacterium]
MKRQYWVSKAAQEHVNIVRDKNYTQINMGPRAPLEKMNIGDWILYYSPTIYYEQEDSICEEFTGISCIIDTRIYPQGGQFPDRWRRDVEFFSCIPMQAKNFVGKVNFLPIEQNWKKILNQPIFKIEQQDFITIAKTILIEIPNKILLF